MSRAGAPSPCPVPAPPHRAALRAGQSGVRVGSRLCGRWSKHKSPRSEAGARRSPHGGRCAPPHVCVIHCVPSPRGVTQTAPGRCGRAGSAARSPRADSPHGHGARRTSRPRESPRSPKLLIQTQPRGGAGKGGPHTNRPACVALVGAARGELSRKMTRAALGVTGCHRTEGQRAGRRP